MTGPTTGPMTGMDESCCCPEYAAMSRRGLLKTALVAGASTTMFGTAVVSASPAAAASAPAVLVVVSLRGACDGLSLVVPHADPAYYAARPSIGIAPDVLLAKDGMFGLHPAFEPLLPFWTAGKVAAVHATGLPAPNRSHFAAMEEVEDANPGSSVRSGWLNRLVGTDADSNPLQGLSMGSAVAPASLFGPQPVMSADSVGSLGVAGDDDGLSGRRRMRSLHTLWDGDRSRLGRSMKSTFDALESFQVVKDSSDDPDNGAEYPGNDLGQALKEVARVIKSDVGVAVLTVDQGDWDHHTDMGNVGGGLLVQNAAGLADSLTAFLTDLGAWADRVTVVTISEFGRRVQENSSGGTDHGYGNVMFLAGAGVKGGTYYGRWPGLSNNLDGDLLVTTDYRSVLSEVVVSRFGASPAAVFPGFVRTPVGVMLGG
jgi:uncharacterized protein (DUF1501 family)